MINKVNNISFKSVLFDESIKKMKSENLEKLKMPIQMSKDLYPDTDVFLGSDDKGELVVRIQKGEPLFQLLDEEVVAAAKMSAMDLYYLITTVFEIKQARNNVWGIEEPYVIESTKGIDNMDSIEIAFHLNRLIKTFRELHPDEKN